MIFLAEAFDSLGNLMARRNYRPLEAENQKSPVVKHRRQTTGWPVTVKSLSVAPCLSCGKYLMNDISFFANNEYSQLLTVCLRLPGAISYDPTQRQSSVLERQKKHYDFLPYDPQIVRTQLIKLADILVENDISVIMIDNTCNYPAQHFPRDTGFVIGDTLFLSQLKSAIRQGETVALVSLFGNREDVHVLNSGTIEGGDVMLDKDIVYVGLSQETSHSGVKSLERALKKRNIDTEIIPINFSHGGVLHLDTVFNIVAPQTALIQLSAFNNSAIKRLEARFDLIPVSEIESRNMEVNTLSINPHTVLVRQESPRIAAQLKQRNMTVLFTDFSEVCKMPGSFRCCSLPLQRKSSF